MKSRRMTLKRLISELERLDISEPPLPPETAALMTEAMGGKTCCPHDDTQECSGCDGHDIHVVNNVIIRVGKERCDICCVEIAVLGGLLRLQFRRCSDQSSSTGIIIGGPILEVQRPSVVSVR